MPYGYNGKILHVNLSDNKIWIETPDEVFYRTFMGGGCLGAYYLLKNTKPGIDPLGPDNVMIFAASIITGAPLSGFSRHSVITKSPLTGIYLDSEAGGFWGPELKFAGYDAIIVYGKAKNPCYLWVHDGEVEIRDASNVWGKVTFEAQSDIRKELSEPKARMLLIGPAGENMVKYACIMNDCKHANGRGGAGAVMGSKNLKAVVCRGTSKPEFYDKDAVQAIGRWFSDNWKSNPAELDLYENGTAGGVDYQVFNEEFPSNNFSSGMIEGGEKLSGGAMSETLLIKREGCYACTVRCKRVVKDEKYDTKPEYGGPEYETTASLGSDIGITDLAVTCKANELCNKYSLDTISTGSVIAFAMECYEKGILTNEYTQGMKLNLGDADSVFKLIDIIAYRKGSLGDLLAEGTKRAAQVLGQGAERYAVHCKGMELGMHDGRAKGTVAIGYAASPVGGDHVIVEHDSDFNEFAPEVYVEQAKPLGLLRRLPAPTFDPIKVRSFVYLQNHFSFMDSLCFCVLVGAPVRAFTFKKFIEAMDAITGWENSLWEVMKVGERRTNLAKVFNIREGMRRKDDVLPERMYETLVKKNSKSLTIDRDEFGKSIDLLYEMMNWDEEGRPRKAKLIELDIAWAIDEIY